MAANDVRDYRQALTDKIIEQLQAGTAPWQKPWDAREGGDRLPYNATTGKPYRGANSLWLSMVGGANGFEDSRWCTFKQAEQQGWQVRKGSKGVRIEFYRFTDQVPMVDGQGNPVLDAEGKQKKQSVALERPIRTTAVVFNVGQMDGVPELAREPRQYEWEPEARAEQILQASGARIFHDQNDRAFYTSLRDEIHLPSQDQFRSPAAYYGTALHELGHWTGHESRLNRKLGNSFGSPEYAKEELRAELASYFLADQLGIPHEPGHHASYVASWVQALQNDHNEIFRAAADAQKITEYVLGLDRDKDLDKDASPERELGVREVGGREAGEAPGGATVRRERREPQPGDTILNTPYKERAEAGQLGAQWAPAAKTWYVPPGVDVAAFGKWAPLPFEQWEANGRQHSPAPTLTQPAREAAPAQAVPVQEAPARTARLVREPQPGDTIISAPYEARREARALGAQWAKQAETWYLPPGVDPAAFAKFAPITAFEQWHANGRQHGPAQGLAQPAPMEPTAVGQLPRNQLAGFVGDAVNRVRDLADKTGLTQHVWDRSVDGLVAAQIANRIPESAFATIDRDAELNAENKVSARINAIRSLRASLGIPSQDDPAEFKAWQASVQPAIAAARDNAPEAQPQRELAAQQARLAEERIARDPNSTREQIADAKAARKEAEGVAMRHDPAIQRVAAAELAREAAPAPFMLVRVQDGLHGASLEGNGLYLPYSRSDEAGQVRNTMHWTVNSIVSDHAYGQFNTAADGSLKGKVVIIADPRELPAPAGLGQVDTWFRLDAREVDGQPARGLGVGPSAVIVAPHDVAVPAGANVLRYSGGVAERDAAVRSVLQQNGVALQGAGMWGWSEGVDSKVWAAETVKAHYPGREADIHVGPHTGSVDERIESLRPAELVERLKTERLYDKDDGSQVPLVEVIKERIDEGMGLISGLQKALPDSEQARIGGFYEKLATDLEGHWKAAQALDRAWQASLTQDVPPPLEPSMPPPLGGNVPPPLPGAAKGQSVEGETPQRRRPAREPDVTKGDVILAVPYEERVAAAKLGAEFGREAKSWYIPAGTDPAPLQKWLPTGKDVIQGSTLSVGQIHDKFAQELRGFGLVLDGEPIMDGKLHRVAVEGGKVKGRDGAYAGYLDGRPAGFMQNFVTGEKRNWKLDGPELTAAQKAELAAQAAITKQQRAATLSAQHDTAASRAQTRWDRAQDMSYGDETSYLVRKQVPPLGVRREGENLLVPARDIHGKLWSVQTIFPQKKALTPDSEPLDKVFTKDAKKEGNFHLLGRVREGEPILVMEGYATGASAHLATGYAVAVAFDSGNLDPVVGALKERHPTNPMFIGADDDRFAKPGKEVNNAGLKKAIEAAHHHDVGVIVPVFSTEGRLTDFNDLHVTEGLGEVKAQIERGITVTMEQSRRQAEQVVAQQLGEHAPVRAPGPNTRHTGEVLGVTGYHVAQHTGRDGTVHRTQDLDTRPRPGAVATVQYAGGKGKVTEKTPEQQKEKSLGR